MKHLKKVIIPAKEEEVIDKVTCDLCGDRIRPAAFDVDKVEIYRKTGLQYPESGSGKTVSVDMCGKCFESRLVPWLREQGVEPMTVEWDY